MATLPECCVSLVCDNGNIEPRHFSKPGSGCRFLVTYFFASMHKFDTSDEAVLVNSRGSLMALMIVRPFSTVAKEMMATGVIFSFGVVDNEVEV